MQWARHIYTIVSVLMTSQKFLKRGAAILEEWRSDVLFNMVATEVCPSEKITNANFLLSAYGDSLQGNIKRRYIEKISVIGLDPFLIPQEKCNPECLPPVES